eukprot:10642890-Alexandrium_andersonii.AAC.1
MGLSQPRAASSQHVVPCRATVAHWRACVSGGLLVASVYMRHSEGLSEANWAILRQLGEVLAVHSRPFVVGGDWNMLPAVLESS